MLDRDQIKEIIPHREPMLLLDGVGELTPGADGKGWLDVTGDMFWCPGHFPGNAVMPGVLIVEAMAQLGAVVMLSHEKYRGKTAYFGGIQKAKFRRKVLPGDRLRLETRIERVLGPVGSGTAKAWVGEELACSCEITFYIGD
jgi:3-hydroxyacyl-[acyl-carrier-protein] dehydratase